MMGIDVDRVIVVTFFIGSALAGAAGVFNCISYQQVWPYMGFQAGLFAFTAAVVGGIGNLPGSVLGGLLIGLAESFCDRLHLVDVPAGDRLRDPDRGHARPPERPARPRGGAKGLMDGGATSRRPGASGRGTGAAVGVDDWVASHEERREQRGGVSARDPERARTRPAAGVLSRRSASRRHSSRFFTSNGYIVRVGFDTLLYMLLALGLNITVGYAGLLDLGYVAFYGFGAYGYAMLASPHVRPALGHAARSSRSSSLRRRSSACSSRCRRGACSATTSRSSRSSSGSSSSPSTRTATASRSSG